MIRQIDKKEFPSQAKALLSAPDCHCRIEIRPGDRTHTEALGGACEYVSCADLLLRDRSLYLAIYREKSAAGALLTKSLWYGSPMSVLLESGGQFYRLGLYADRSHIAGGIFTEMLVRLRETKKAADIGAVWEMSFDSLEPLEAKPEGIYTEETMGLFETHLDQLRKPEGAPSEAKSVTGCRFSLAPMSDDFIDIILSSIAKVDTSRVWSATDEFSTVYRGKRVHVLDALKACFLHSYREGVHMAMNATISKGCPGDREKDAALEDAVWAEEDTPVNEPALKDIHFPAAAKFELYPLGRTDYMEQIAHVVDMALEMGVYDRSAYYVSVIKGDVQELFRYFSRAAEYCEQNMDHYILEITFAVNFPEGE